MLTFVGLSLMNPHAFTWGFARTFSHSQIVGLATILGYFFSSDQKTLPKGREVVLVAALWGMFFFSTLVAARPEIALEKFTLMSKILLMMFLTACILNSEDRLHMLVRVIALSLGFYAIKLGAYTLFTGGQSRIYGPEDSYLFGENSIGLALVINLPLLFYLLRVETHRCLRWIIRGMIVLSYPAVAGTFSRGAWIGMAVVSGIIGVKSKHGLIVAAILVIFGTTTGVGWLAQDAPQLAARYDTLVNYDEDPSAQSRFWNWEFCGRVGLAHPAFGAGFDFYSTEAYVTYFPEFLQRWPGKVWSCHSAWMTIVAEHGVFAFLLWIGLFSSCLISLRRIRSYAKGVPHMARIDHLADLLIVAFVGFGVTGTFLDSAYFEIYYQLVALVIILSSLLQREGRDRDQNTKRLSLVTR
jgi:probable O-glycosylation ligase (exosortase A-associated)